MSTETAKPEKDPNVFNVKHGRLSFPHLFKKVTVKGNETGEPKFSGTILLRKEAIGDLPSQADQIKLIQDRIDHLIKTELKLKKLPADKICLRDGDEKDKDGYEGHMFIAASNSKKPKVLDQTRNPMDEDDPRLFAGCYVNMVIRLWVQDHKQYGKRINASLEAVQYVRTGEAFGKEVDLDSVLEDEEEEDGTSLLD